MKGTKKKRTLVIGLALLILICCGAVLGYKKYTDNKAIKANEGANIVCFGDSIWDLCRDETSIACFLEERLDANVTNLAIGGTSAAKRYTGGEDLEKWNSLCFVEIVDAITDGERNAYLDAENDRIGIYDVNYEEVDYFLIAYGLNDYFSGIRREGEDPYDLYTYAGALRHGVEKLQQAYPNAKIIILSLTYSQLYSYGKVKADSHELDYGGGTGPDYVETAKTVAQEYDLGFSNNYDTMHINVYNGPKYLIDATHLTEKGRRRYAKIVAAAIVDEYKRYMQE